MSGKLNFVAGLLGLTGILHVIEPFRTSFTPIVIVMVIFGIAYLVIGYLVFRAMRLGYYLGAVIPAIGFLGGLVQIIQNFTVWMVFLMVIDAVVIPCCIYLIRKSRPKLSASMN